MNLGVVESTATLRMVVLGCDYITSLGLYQLLNSADFIQIVGGVDNAAQVHSLMAEGPVDLVLVDSSMEPALLEEACRTLHEAEHPPTVVVMGDVSAEQTECLVFCGVSAILHHGLIAEDLPVALRMIHRGGALLLSTSAREAIMRRSGGFDAQQRARFESLNTRERVVAQGVAEGMTNVQLANSMHMSEATVKLLVSNVMNRLGVANRVQIAVVVTEARVA